MQKNGKAPKEVAGKSMKKGTMGASVHKAKPTPKGKMK